MALCDERRCLLPQPGEHRQVLHRKVSLQRFVTHITICYVLISIHLPYLRRGSDDSGFARSRQAALEAEIEDHRARRWLREEVDWSEHFARDTFVGGLFFYFHATSTLGICLLSETDKAKAKALLPLLDDYLETAREHQRQQSVDPNRCVRQEVSIVSLIRGRVKRKFGLCETDAAIQGSAATCPRQTISQWQSPSSSNAAVMRQPQLAHNISHIETQTLPIGSYTPSRYAPPAESMRTELIQTRQPEVGEDAYDWWTWLVSSLSPSDLLSSLTPDETAPSANAKVD